MVDGEVRRTEYAIVLLYVSWHDGTLEKELLYIEMDRLFII